VIDIVPLDKKIPIPGPPRTGRKTQYPWQNAEVGDSFFIHGRNAVSDWTQKTGFEFITRAVAERGVAGMRIEATLKPSEW
jgi:hypothetical protein